MKAYVVASGVIVSPFGELARDLPMGGVPLIEWQAALLRRFGLTPVYVASLEEIPSNEPRIVTYDNVIFTRRVLKSFLGRWKPRDRAARLALPIGCTFIQRFSALQDFDTSEQHALFNLWGLPAGSATLERAVPVEVIYAERVLELPVPRRATGVERWIHPVTSSICFHVTHWIHLLQANLLSVQVRWVDEIVTHPLWAATLLLRGLLGVRGRMAWRIGAAANRIGRGSDIHPTARVEGCLIGRDVTIGPQALVRGAILGDGTVIEQRADVSYSVLGKRAFVSKHSIVYATVAMDEAELCMKGMQMCLVGRQAALTARATPLDVLPGRKIRVKQGTAYPEIDLPVLGACFGHRTFIGADVYTGPGREIPNDTKIAIDPQRVVSRLPADLDPDRFYTVRDGKLVPID